MKIVQLSWRLYNQKENITQTVGVFLFALYDKNGLFCLLTAIFGGFEGVFSFINNKSAILCPAKTEVADFVSFKGSIVQEINLQRNVVLSMKEFIDPFTGSKD